ncbi:MAG: tellurite resistance TerB family protein [Fretibacterium sp.]|nr:tellurite resistance TerB family protein [Fretibacterium sp.]
MAINFMDLLGSAVQGGMTSPSSSSRMQNAASSLGSLTSLFGGGDKPQEGLGGLLGSLMSGGASVLNRAGSAVGGRDNLAAAGIGALLGALSGKSGSASMGGIGGGLMGLLGMMAYKALTKNGPAEAGTASGIAEGAAPSPRMTEQQFASDGQGGPGAAGSAESARLREADAEIILTAMIDAAKADGQVDTVELNRLTGRIKATGAGQEGLNYLIAQLQAPMSTEKIAAATRGRPELAAQVYSASLMCIEVDTQAERDYLNRLAEAMNLSPAVVRNIEQIVGMQKA